MNPFTPSSMWNTVLNVGKIPKTGGKKRSFYKKKKNTAFKARIVTLIMQPVLLCLNYLSLCIWRALLNSYVSVYLKKEFYSFAKTIFIV